MQKPANPFPTSGYYGPEYFCDRRYETDTLLANLKGGQSTVLTAIRRMGKTALIHHVLGMIPKDWQPVYVDILHTEKEPDFLNSLASGILNSIPEKTSLGKKIWDFIKNMRPVMSFDPLSGMPQVSFEGGRKKPEVHVSALFSFLAKQEKPVVIAIDEFQQIMNYPEQNTDAWLRSIIQELPNVYFIFSGSHQHILNELFSSPAKPFFRSAQFLKTGKISYDEYASFISGKFQGKKKEIDKEVIDEILTWTNRHTYYVQLLCNRIFVNSGKRISTGTWQSEALKLLKEQETVFFQYREMLTGPQWQLLKSISRADRVFEPTSKDFVQTYELGSPSTVLRSLETLLRKELIFKERDESGKPFYAVYDVLFQRWIESVPH